MSHQLLRPHPLLRMAAQVAPRLWQLAAVAGVLLLAAFIVPNPVAGLALMSIAGTLLAVTLLMRGLALVHRRLVVRERREAASVVEHDPAPAFTTDRAGRIVYQNIAAAERFGTAGKSMLRRLEGVFANPSSTLYRLQARAEAIGAAREDVNVHGGLLRLSVHRMNGGYLWRLDEIAGVDGGVQGVDRISLPMLVADASGAILSMNPAMRVIVGAHVRTMEQIFTHLPRPGEVVELNGPEGPFLAAFTVIESGAGRQEVYLVPHDKGSLPEGEDLGFEDMPIGLVRLGPAGEVLAANRYARELLNTDPTPDDRFSDLVEGLGRSVGDWLADGLAGRTIGRPEIMRATRTEEEAFLQVTLRRTMEGGKPALVALLNDATELKTLEAKFVQSQKMQAIGQLAGGVAHDFNNLLTAISGHCDLLLLRHDENDSDYADLVQIHQNANRAASLVGQLLAFSRKQTLQPQLIDLRDALTDLGHLLNRLMGERVRLHVVPLGDMDLIRADPRQLEQVLINLVVNARDAMPQGGQVRIETRNQHLTEPLCRDRAIVPPGDYVVLRVVDKGVGIPEDKLSKIFEPFYTTKRAGEGTGLGLSTVYGIVKQSGGFIFVDSVLGEGTTFSLYFPAHDPVDSPAPAPVVAAPVLKHGEGVVLLVEDEAPVRAFASRALRLRGYTVIEAEQAEQALEIVADTSIAIDIIVTDVIMPGMDGPTWVREALHDRPDMRVIFMSGYAEDSFTEAQARIPNSVFLPKPFSLSELTATVQAQLEGEPAQAVQAAT